MTRDIIRKTEAERAAANLPDYAAARAGFAWDQARARLDGLPGGGLNIAHEAVDRHVAHGQGDRLALRWLARDGRSPPASPMSWRATARCAATGSTS
jgi:acetyl-CoA synthetase